MSAAEDLFAEYELAIGAFTATLPASWRTHTRTDGPVTWRVCESPSPLPIQGWKLHITASPVDALALVRVVLPELVSAGTSFKLPADLSGFIHINAGLVGHTQVGKIVTAYPASDRVLMRLVEGLDPLWRPGRAPAVPSDLAVGFGGALYMRYGAFDSHDVVADPLGFVRTVLRAPDGTRCPDERSDCGRQPEWAPPPPIESARSDEAINVSAPIKIEESVFLPVKVLTAKLRGRVSLAVRLADCRLVIVRSAIRGIEGDEFGNDVMSRLENEKSVLLRLQGTGIGPEFVAHDPDAGHLVVTDVGGVLLSELTTQQQLSELPRLAAKVAELHALGCVHRDLKASNVRTSPDGVHLIDLELASDIGTPRPIPAGTEGYVPPEERRAVVDPSYDVYGLGSCLTHVAGAPL